MCDELCSRSGGDAREAMTVGCKPTNHLRAELTPLTDQSMAHDPPVIADLWSSTFVMFFGSNILFVG